MLGRFGSIPSELPFDPLYVPAGAVPVTVSDEAAPLIGLRDSLREILKLSPVLVISGHSGAGRSTFLQSLLLEYVKGHPVESRVPLLIGARRIADAIETSGLGLEEALKADLARRSQGVVFDEMIDSLLRGGRAIILVDDLHEIMQLPRSRFVLEELEDAVRSFTRLGNKFVLTVDENLRDYCRLRLRGVTEATMTGFSDDDVTDYVNRWCRGLIADNPDETRDSILSLLTRDRRLAELSGSPMLTALMTLSGTILGGAMPIERLQEAAVLALTRTWSADGAALDRGGNAPLLDRLGWLAAKEELDLRPLTSSLLIDGREGEGSSGREQHEFSLVPILTSGVLRRGSPESFEFRYRSLRSFLLARYMVRRAGDPDVLAAQVIRSGDFARRKELASALVGYLRHVDDDPDRSAAAANAVLREAANQGVSELERLELFAEMCAVSSADEVVRGDAESRRLIELSRSDRLAGEQRVRAALALDKIGDDRTAVALATEFELCFVPAGDVRLGKAVRSVDPFFISKYPVTNAQFREFGAHGGYSSDDWWSPDGLAWRDELKPRGQSFLGQQFLASAQPVVAITWYEASAYCKWLTEEVRTRGYLSLGWEIRLPTELQWLAAARGCLTVPAQPVVGRLSDFASRGRLPDDLKMVLNGAPERSSPWGSTEEAAPLQVAGRDSPFPVGVFPALASPYGCEDLTGNIWQWLRSAWGPEWREACAPVGDAPSVADARMDGTFCPMMVKGGSFLVRPGSDGQEHEYHLDIDYRARNYPDVRHVTHGLRICLEPAP